MKTYHLFTALAVVAAVASTPFVVSAIVPEDQITAAAPVGESSEASPQASTTFASLAVSAAQPEDPESKAKAGKASKGTREAAQGRYIVMIGGCNGCHTRGFTEANAKVPEADWLTGNTMGYYGPWGTTYPINLRLLIPSLPEKDWVKFARDLKTLPPMPWWVLHEMHESDLRAIHQFVTRLGPKGEKAPVDLAPEQKPNPPYVHFVLKTP